MGALELTPRHKEILRLVTLSYLQEGQAVGSRTISRLAGISLSPATIRNVMMDLEEMGYLRQPHTSAGRLPTLRGLRFFLENLLASRQPAFAEQQRLSDFFNTQARASLNILAEASRLLCSLTGYTAVGYGPVMTEIPCRSFEFLSLDSHKVLVLIVTSLGSVVQRMVWLDEPHSQEDLNRMAGFLNDMFRNFTLTSIRGKIEELLSDYEAVSNRMLHRALEISRQALDSSHESEEVHVEGTSKILETLKDSPSTRLQDIMAVIEERSAVLEIFQQRRETPGVQVTFGSETRFPQLEGLTFLTATCSWDGRSLGMVGVVGPNFMPYGRMIGLLDSTAGYMSRYFSGMAR